LAQPVKPCKQGAQVMRSRGLLIAMKRPSLQGFLYRLLAAEPEYVVLKFLYILHSLGGVQVT
jgi:hypothetical protein